MTVTVTVIVTEKVTVKVTERKAREKIELNRYIKCMSIYNIFNLQTEKNVL